MLLLRPILLTLTATLSPTTPPVTNPTPRRGSKAKPTTLTAKNLTEKSRDTPSNKGSSYWVSPEDQKFTLTWVADDARFQPKGPPLLFLIEIESKQQRDITCCRLHTLHTHMMVIADYYGV